MTDRGSFHYRNLETCKELQVAYKLLLDLKRHTSRDIREATGCECGAHTVISELRANIEKDGYGIEQEYDGKTADGNRVSWYKLITIKKEAPRVNPELKALYNSTTPNGNKISEYRLIKLKKELPNVPEEIKTFYINTRKIYAGYPDKTRCPETVKIAKQIADLVNRFPGLKEIT